MQIQPLTSIPHHYLPHPASGCRKALDTGTSALVKLSPPHISGPKFQPATYPSPPMSNPPSPPRRYIPTSSASEDRHGSQEAGRAYPIPPQSRPESTTAFRRENLPATVALPNPGQYQPTTQSLYSPRIAPPPQLSQGHLLDQAHYYPQRAAISPRTVGASLVPQTEIGRPAQALRGAKSSRRGKTHVQKACINCKKAHLSCDAQRPCARCVASGKQETCQDVEHKKRGRPRLRDDRDSRLGREIQAAEQRGMLPEAQPGPVSSYPPSHRRTQSGRILRSTQRSSVGQIPQSLVGQTDPRLIQRHTITGAAVPQPSPYSPRGGLAARVFTTLNFRIVRANQQFRDQFANGSDVQGRELSEFVDHRNEGDLQRLGTDLRNEREQREPLSLPTIYSSREQEAIGEINEAEIESYTVGSLERSEMWTFVQFGRQLQMRQVDIRLGKVQGFPFVVLTLPHYASRSLPAPMSGFGAPPVPPMPQQFEPQFHPSPSLSTVYPQPGSGPSTPSLSLQSLASSLPPTSAPVTAYGLSSSRYDPTPSGYFPAQPRSQPSTQPSTQPGSAGFDPTAAFGVPPPSVYGARPAGNRPTSTVSEPAGARPSVPEHRPTSYPGQPRTFQTMQAESEGTRTPSEAQADPQAEDDDARKRRRLNIREITD